MAFTGKMDFRPNIDGVTWFVHEVLPAIRARVPDARFYIVGQKPHPRVSALGEEPGVIVTGYVDDVVPTSTEPMYAWSLCELEVAPD